MFKTRNQGKNVKVFARKTLLFSLISALSITISACGVIPKEEDTLAPPIIEPAKIVYDELEIKKGTIEVSVRGIASFQSASLENAFFKYNAGYMKNIAVRLGDKVKKGDLLAQLETEDLEIDLQKKKITLQMDELIYNDIKSKLNAAEDEQTKNSLNLQLKQQELRLKLDKIDIDGINKAINRAKLTSAISGDVVFIDTINPGDRITTYKTVVTIADTSKLEVQYSGDNMDKFDMGAKVTVEVEGKNYNGKVVLNPSNYPADTPKDTKKVVKIKLDKMPEDVSVGTSANVNLLIEKKENVIVIPRNLVRTDNNRNYVQMLENGLRTERNVELGIKNATEVEIVKGLSEGEKILR